MIDRYPVRWLMTAGALGFTGGLWLLSVILQFMCSSLKYC
jgi:hypothetical protein